MKPDDLDRVLSQKEEILPSSGFAAAVMDAVRLEASAPPPIPFPWKRAVPGIAAACLAVVLVFVEAIRHQGPQQLPPAWLPVLELVIRVVTSPAVGWLTLTQLLAFASVTLSMRLSSGRG